MTKFSEELVQKTIAYYDDELDHRITRETAQEYLESMAGLYLVMRSFAGKPVT